MKKLGEFNCKVLIRSVNDFKTLLTLLPSDPSDKYLIKVVQQHAPIAIYIEPSYSLSWDHLGDAKDQTNYPWYKLPTIVKYNTRANILKLC